MLGTRYDAEQLLGALEAECRAKASGGKQARGGFIPNALSTMAVTYLFVGEGWGEGLTRHLSFVDHTGLSKAFWLQWNDCYDSPVTCLGWQCYL